MRTSVMIGVLLTAVLMLSGINVYLLGKNAGHVAYAQNNVQYKVAWAAAGVKDLEAILNRGIKDGWELVATIPGQSSGLVGYAVVFKK